MITTLFVLLVIYQVKHFLADYPLQDEYMLGKFKDGWDFVGPLFAHVTVHGLFTLAVCLVVSPRLWWLALVDMGVHFAMDRLKAGKKYLGRFEALSKNEFAGALHQLEWLNETNFELHSAAEGAQKRIKRNTYFWWALGLDQMVHHLTHYFIIWMLAQ